MDEDFVESDQSDTINDYLQYAMGLEEPEENWTDVSGGLISTSSHNMVG